MAKSVPRRVTADVPESKPPDMIDPERSGRCGWCLTRDHETCVWVQFRRACPCPCDGSPIQH